MKKRLVFIGLAMGMLVAVTPASHGFAKEEDGTAPENTPTESSESGAAQTPPVVDNSKQAS